MRADRATRSLAAIAGASFAASFGLARGSVTRDDGRAAEGHLRVWDTSTWELLQDLGGIEASGRSVTTGATVDSDFVAVYAVA